jgi:glucosylceramidase
MVLDRQGGPNWFKNWCIAPVIVDPDADEVYFTPLYYVMSHFSKFIRPEAVRIGITHSSADIMTTSVQNQDGSTVVILFNPGSEAKDIDLNFKGNLIKTNLKDNSIQTILIH